MIPTDVTSRVLINNVNVWFDIKQLQNSSLWTCGTDTYDKSCKCVFVCVCMGGA